MPPLHACVRGFGQVERVNHPDRLRHPLRRIGPARQRAVRARSRWDEALDEVARQMLPRPRHLRPGGHPRLLAHRQPRRCSTTALAAQRLLHMFGGCTELWSNISAEAEVFAVRMTYGAKADYKSARPRAHRLRQLAAHDHVGLEPGRRAPSAPARCSTSSCAKKHGVRIICVDPRRDAHQPRAGRRARLHPAVDRRRRADRHGLRDRQRGAARPGLPRPPRARLRRGAPAARRAGRAPRTAPTCSGSPTACARRRSGRRPITGMPAETIRRLAVEFATTQAGRAPLRLRAGAHDLRRAVPPRRLRARRDHRQRRASPGGNSG